MYSVTSYDFTAKGFKNGGYHYHGLFRSLTEANREIASIKKNYNKEGNYSKYKINVKNLAAIN